MAENAEIVVVTGLPRSGTSLMMQMLAAGGVPVLTDACRAADVSNPRGYFEYESVKRLPADNSWLGEACGKAVKVITQLVPFLPRGFEYRVLVMQRDLGEILRSQTAMLDALSRPTAGDPQALALAFERNLDSARRFLSRHPRTAVETVNHRTLMARPAEVAARVAEFLGRPGLDRDAMTRSVDLSLYRARSDEPLPAPNRLG